MAYLALYRRYRPTAFDRFIGQEHVVRTLKNQIKNDNVSHAYLFCGARGTGKTSAAKIFARAINCLTPDDGSPCGKCAACLATKESNNMDIVEIDAASNNRVEEVRDLREKAQYPPVSCKYKVYIVDEVHMLSESAFNALLKTLEEPPRHAVFILATTEPQKLPATILSRCMRFDFKLIAEDELNKLIASIFADIKLEYEPEAVRLIAKTGEGSVRDCLSIADKCVSYTEGKLKYSDVLEVLGSADKGKIISLVETIIDGDIGKTLEKIDELIGLGKNVTMLSRDISGVLKDIAVIMSVDNSKKILALPDERYNELKAIATKSNINAALRFLELFASIEQELRYSQNPRVLFEVTALKCAKATNDLSIDGLLSRMTAMEAQLKVFGSQIAASKAVAVVEPTKKTEESVDKALAQKESPPQQKKKTEAAGKSITKATFSEFVAAIRNSNNALLFKIVQTLDGEAKDGNLILSAQSGDSKNFLKMKEVIDGFRLTLANLGYSGDVIIKDFEAAGSDIESELKQTFGMDIEIK